MTSDCDVRIDACIEAMRELKAEYRRVVRESDVALQQLDAVRAELQGSREKEARSAEQRVEQGELRARVGELEALLDQQRDRIKQLEAENAEFKKVSRIVALQNENQRLKQEIAAMQERGASKK